MLSSGGEGIWNGRPNLCTPPLSPPPPFKGSSSSLPSDTLTFNSPQTLTHTRLPFNAETPLHALARVVSTDPNQSQPQLIFPKSFRKWINVAKRRRSGAPCLSGGGEGERYTTFFFFFFFFSFSLFLGPLSPPPPFFPSISCPAIFFL